MKLEVEKITKEKFIEAIKDETIKEKILNNADKEIIFFLEDCEYLDKSYLSISLFNITKKMYIPEEKIIYIDEIVSFIYLPKKKCSFTLPSPLNTEEINYIMLEQKYHRFKKSEVVLIGNEEIFLVSDRGCFDIKNKIVYNLKFDFTVYPASTKRGTVFLLLTKEFQKYAVIPTYTTSLTLAVFYL